MMRMTRRRTTTRTKLVVYLAAYSGCAAILAGGFTIQAEKKPQESFAVVRGTVFLESGISQPGARVILSAKEQPGKKLQEQVSSPHGEFAFRVPAKPSTYVIRISLKGFDPVSKDVEVTGPEEIHKTLLLVPASNK
jgi:hypothetical protein